MCQVHIHLLENAIPTKHVFFPGAGFDALGGVLQPVSAGQTNSTSPNNNNNNNNTNNNTLNQQTGSPLLTGDLESSLASLAENLTINSRTAPMKWDLRTIVGVWFYNALF